MLQVTLSKWLLILAQTFSLCYFQIMMITVSSENFDECHFNIEMCMDTLSVVAGSFFDYINLFALI